MEPNNIKIILKIKDNLLWGQAFFIIYQIDGRPITDRFLNMREDLWIFECLIPKDINVFHYTLYVGNWDDIDGLSWNKTNFFIYEQEPDDNQALQFNMKQGNSSI